MWDDVLPEFCEARARHDAVGGDARRRARAVPRARVRRVLPGERDGGVDPAPGARDGHRSARRRAASRFDTGEREGKRSRAFCAPVRVPDEVYLVLRPHGGQTDWNTFLHELGHALHFAYMRPDLPFEYRWLGDNSITEGYAMLFDHLHAGRGWLQRYTELDARRTAGVPARGGLRGAALPASLLREADLRDRALRRRRAVGRRCPTSTSSALTTATTLPLRPRRRVRRRRSALLRGALSARVAAAGADHRDAGRALRRGLVAESARGAVDLRRRCSAKAQRELAHEQAERVAGKRLAFAPLIRSVERMLG